MRRERRPQRATYWWFRPCAARAQTFLPKDDVVERIMMVVKNHEKACRRRTRA